MKPFSLYIHIPFCSHKCPYCDFNTYAVPSAPEDEYVDALLQELSYREGLPEWGGREIQTIFFGGGTPSLFSPRAIGRILGGTREKFAVADQAEISMEVNPGGVGFDQLSGYKAFGVNRFSIGAQSFSPKRLAILGRTHSRGDVELAVSTAIQAGITDVSIDLMYGCPGQSEAEFAHDLQCAASLPISHLSIYSLTIEKGTPYYTGYKKGALKLPQEESVVSMMEEIERFLPLHGFTRYEISNFARGNHRSRHNLAYWNGDDYIGLGAGAHSYLRTDTGGRRWSNYALPAKYMAQAREKGGAESWSESLSREASIFEFFFLGLRKIEGVSKAEYRDLFGEEVEVRYQQVLDPLIEAALLVVDEESIRLSPRGLRVADSVVERFILEE